MNRLLQKYENARSKLIAAFAWVGRSVLAIERTTVLALVGFAALLYGIAKVNRAAAWIVGGFLVLVYAALDEAGKALRERRRQLQEQERQR